MWRRTRMGLAAIAAVVGTPMLEGGAPSGAPPDAPGLHVVLVARGVEPGEVVSFRSRATAALA